MKYKKRPWGGTDRRIVYRNVFVRMVNYRNLSHFSPWLGTLFDYAEIFTHPNRKRDVVYCWKRCYRNNHRNWHGVDIV
jgi:hypothetical protein